MESRKITIISSASQSRKEIMSSAETLAELKRDLTNAGISYNDMTFMEGYTKTELKSDESVLPVNVPTKKRDAEGNVITTNELVFMLTAPQKKIKSGAMSYSEMKAYVKNNNLAEEFKKKFHKNYTQGSSSEFTKFIASVTKTETKKEAPAAPKAETPKTNVPEAVAEDTPVVDNLPVKELMGILNMALNKNMIAQAVYNEIKALLNKEATKPAPLSDSEIKAMFDFI